MTLPSIPIGQFSSPLQPFSVLAADGGQGMGPVPPLCLWPNCISGWAAPAEDPCPQGLQVHPPPRDVLRALQIITGMLWGQAAHRDVGLCSATEFIKVQGGSLQRSCARQWKMLCTACLTDLCPLWMHHFKSCCRAQSRWNIQCNQKGAGPLRTTQMLMGGTVPITETVLSSGILICFDVIAGCVIC